MKFIVYDTQTKRTNYEFCEKKISPYWFITRFSTDFTYESLGKTLIGKAGEYLILKPGSVIYFGATDNSNGDCVNDWLYFDSVEFDAFIDKYKLPVGISFNAGSYNYLKEFINNLHKELSFKLDGFEDNCNYIFNQTLIDIFREYNKSFLTSYNIKLDIIRGKILQNLSKNWTLKEMADLCGYSVSRFSAAYKNKFKISPVNDLINARIVKAKSLLIVGGFSISTVSEMVGFTSIYYFSKYFKAKEGVSPSEFIKRNV